MNLGEVWSADLDPVRGSEQAGQRPVLIIQGDPLNVFLRTLVIVPFTPNLRWARFAHCVQVGAGEGGVPHDSVLLCHQIRVSDKTRLVQHYGKVSPATMLRVDQALRLTPGM